MIAKGAENSSCCVRRIIPFRSAREAFRAILNAGKRSPGTVLLPAYIGWSPREGSGVFDPIASLGLEYSFYALDDRLRIDLDALRTELQGGSVDVLVIIHYFGYVDPSYQDAVKLAREYGVFVLEDEAHAMLTDIVGGISGRLGDACIYSFHKMLPVKSGGAAIVNDPHSPLAGELIESSGCSSPLNGFDLLCIAEKRRNNALLLDRFVRDLSPEIEPLFGPPASREFPQSYPVLIRSDYRDRLYHEMNAAGFGVVSLYHTLISEIPSDRFPSTRGISRHILNLPVHQDASEEGLRVMVGELAVRVTR